MSMNHTHSLNSQEGVVTGIGGCQYRKLFTLIELLVVIAIIGILASLLLPSLIRAKYQAKHSICTSNIKQQALGLMMYAGDNDEYYPGLRVNGHPLDFSLTRLKDSLGTEKTTEQLADYWGEDAVSQENYETIARCPLALPHLNVGGYIRTSYTQYYGFQHSSGTSVMRGEPLRKVGGYFTMGNETYRHKYNVLISDVFVHYWDYPQQQRYANHTDLQAWWNEPGESPHWFLPTSYRSAQYYYPQMKGQFCGQDGSIRNYTAPAGSTEGFTPDNGYKPMYSLIPTDFVEGN